MNNVVTFESRTAQINSAIDAGVDAIVSQPNFSLPKSDTALVRSYVDKIQGTYDVERAKRDTDNQIRDPARQHRQRQQPRADPIDDRLQLHAAHRGGLGHLYQFDNIRHQLLLFVSNVRTAGDR